MIKKYLLGLLINAVVFLLLFYSTKVLSLFAYPFLASIMCSLIGYKLTKNWWFGFMSFIFTQILYFGVYQTIALKGAQETFWEQLYYNFTSVDGRWMLSLHMLGIFISLVTSGVIYWRINKEN